MLDLPAFAALVLVLGAVFAVYREGRKRPSVWTERREKLHANVDDLVRRRRR